MKKVMIVSMCLILLIGCSSKESLYTNTKKLFFSESEQVVSLLEEMKDMEEEKEENDSNELINTEKENEMDKDDKPQMQERRSSEKPEPSVKPEPPKECTMNPNQLGNSGKLFPTEAEAEAWGFWYLDTEENLNGERYNGFGMGGVFNSCSELVGYSIHFY